jgi:predicted membrane channel-forming protein YqfA (hemolysin III family)
MLRPIQNWLDRHKNPASFWLHMLGIPACFVAAPILLVMRLQGHPTGLVALGMFGGGYALQFLGHLIEGNRSGEEELVRRIAGRLSRRGVS